jgi:uncharacterized repeat protein (TIGR01451 family)
LLSTYVVNSAIDQPAVDPTAGAETASGVITFRSAIQAANAHPNDASGPDRIEFDIPGSGVHIIPIFPELPAITDPIIIDGYSQPGAKANTLAVGSDAVLLINIDASRLAPANGLSIKAGNSTVRGLVMTHFFGDAISLTDKGGNVIAGNYLGIPASGDVALPNVTGVGIGFGSDGNRIGGTDPADRNVISGNAAGLRIIASSNNVVQGNYFGLEPSGMRQLGGQGQGNIIIKSGAPGVASGPATGNLIGGTAPGARNVMAAGGAGVILGGDQASLTTGNLVEGNYIGTDATGAGDATFHNNGPGVLLANGTGASSAGATMNTIGGSTPEARNVISNNNDGVVVESAAPDNLIQGNYIGTDASGSTVFGNTTGITVRARTTVLGNLISGNVDGILVQGADQSVIQGNLIGTNSAGTAAVPNQYGVVLSGARNVTVGGTTAQARNVISGNQVFGVSLERFGVGNRIQGNFIGTDILGTNGLGNAVNGITINFQDAGTQSDTTIGGPEAGAGNTIAFNANNGVFIQNPKRSNESVGSIDSNTIFANVLNGVVVTGLNVGTPHFRITRNSIFNNGGLGIDLGYDGVTPNDSMGHVGPNNFQNFPLLASVTASSAATEVSGTLASTPNSSFRIEFFANADLDPSGHGEGQTFLGFVNVTTDATGNVSFSNILLPPEPAGENFVAATATDAAGNTSEFSTVVESTPSQAAADLAISMTAAPSPVDPGGNVMYTMTVKNNGPDAANNVAVTAAVPTSTTFVSLAAPAGWTASEPAAGGVGNVSATVATLNSGDSAVFSFVVHVNSNTPGNATLTASSAVTSDTADPDTSNNNASASVTVAAPVEQTDLAIAVSVSPHSVPQGEALAFTITVTNNGPVDASNVVMAMNTPAETTFRSMTAPSGWTTATPAVSGTGRMTASLASLAVGTSASFTVDVRADSNATVGSTITGVAGVTSGTLDSNPANNTAQDSATVTGALTANVSVAISGNINPATVGQDVTYTVTASSPGEKAATGVELHVTVPGTGTIISLGGGTQSSSGVDFTVGSLPVGATRQFQIVVRPTITGSITLTASATADPGVIVGSPASVTTQVISASPGLPTPPPVPSPGEPTPPTVPSPGEPTPPPVPSPGEPTPPTVPSPGEPTPPAVVTAVRYGFHEQATILVVTFSGDVDPHQAANPRNYTVLVSSNGTHRAVPISRAFYNSQTHEATLRVAEKIYIFRPWQLEVGHNVKQHSRHGLVRGGDGFVGRNVEIEMSLRSLMGPAWSAPEVSHVGVSSVPQGPRASLAKKVAHPFTAHPAKGETFARTSLTAKPLKPALDAPAKSR